MIESEKAQELAEKLLPDNRETLLADLSTLVDQTQTMIDGLPKVVDAMDEIIEKLRTPPRLQDMLSKMFKKSMEDAPWHEGDSWKGAPDLNERIGSGAVKAQEYINKVFRERMTEVSSIRAMARTQIALARGLQNVGLLSMVLAKHAELPNDIADIVASLQLKEEEV